jgi:uncharacterized protein (DUF362 family)
MARGVLFFGIDDGSMTGRLIRGKNLLASTDWVAIDMVGVAILKFLGSNPGVMRQKIFEQEQIARAVGFGLSPSCPSDIEVVPADEKSMDGRNRIVDILRRCNRFLAICLTITCLIPPIAG